MASDTAYSPSPPRATTNPADNHRKRRRNRTRVSCLNCYASKRKCDRKRPCTRCIKHGLTGLCFYELDDPAARDDCTVDETTRLRRRIAELESVVRAMNNRPHPRWTAPGGVTHRAQPESQPQLRRPRRVAARSSVEAFFDAEAGDDDTDDDVKVKLEPEFGPPEFTPSERGPASPAEVHVHSPFGSPLTPLLSDLFAEAPYGDDDSDAKPLASHSRVSTPSSQEGLPLAKIFGAPSLHTSLGIQTSPPPEPPCDCLAAATLHSPLVYFASALRASREALEGTHPLSSSCVLLRRIMELDDHIFSAAPPDQPPPALGFIGGGGIETDPLVFSVPAAAAGGGGGPSSPAPTLPLSPYTHHLRHADAAAFAFLDASVQPALLDWT